MPITASKYIKNSELKTSYLSLFNYKSESRGQASLETDMYGLLFVSSEIAISGEKILKFAWDGIIDGFEYSKTDSVNESLKLGLAEATRRVKQLITNDKEIGKHGVNVNFTIFASNNGAVYIGLLGESDIFVYKEGRLVDIYEMLASKKAKTAAVAIGEDDLIFSSTEGYLKENLPKLIAAKGVQEISLVLEELGEGLGDDSGIVVFSKVSEKKIEKKEREVAKIDKRKRRKEVSQPTDSDYIPISKTNKKIFKGTSQDRDLKEFLSSFFKKFAFLKVWAGKVSAKTSLLLSNMSLKVSSTFQKMGEKIKGLVTNRVGKKRWFKKFSAGVTQSNLGKKPSKFKEFRIDGYKEKDLRTKRIKQFVFILLGVALVVGGVIFTIDQKEARERSREANSIFDEVGRLVNEAKSNLGTDRESAEMALFKASERLGKIPTELKKGDSEKLENLNAQVLGIQDSLFKRSRLSGANIEKYYNTYTFNNDSRPEDIGIFRDSNGRELLIVTDPGTKSVYTRSLYDNKVEAISDSNGVLSKPYKIYVRPDSIFIYDQDNGILKSTYSNGTFQPFVKLSGLSIESMKANGMVEFAVITPYENAYILDREKEALLRSINFEGGYSLVSVYLSKEEYKKANDVFADDLSIYITAEGENGIYRYINQGSGMGESPISISGIDTPVENALCGFTFDSLNKGFYIFDSGKKRLLKFEKPMESGEKRHPNELLLLNQYVYEEDVWNDVKDIVVDYDEKYLYMLDDTTIWKVRL